jgi:hypothetical protein
MHAEEVNRLQFDTKASRIIFRRYFFYLFSLLLEGVGGILIRVQDRCLLGNKRRSSLLPITSRREKDTG